MHEREHIVQFYGHDEARLAGNVAAFLADGFRAGGGGLIVAAPERRASIAAELDRRMSGDPSWRERTVWRNDAETLELFMRDGKPDAELFEATVAQEARNLCLRFGHVRAYGEMVGRLWDERAYSAAIALERLWNALLERIPLELFCGYRIDELSADFQMPAVRAILASHTAVAPALARDFQRAIERAMHDMLGEHHGSARFAPRRSTGLSARLPAAERAVLRLRSALPRHADAIVARAKADQESRRAIE